MAHYFISDLHLDPEEPVRFQVADRWLASIQPDATSLYILGDLFESWIGDDVMDPALDPLFERLHTFQASGIPVFFMPGNRDFLVGAEAARRGGWTALEEPQSVDCFGTRVALIHGDSLCTADHEYQRFRAQVRDPNWQRTFLAQPAARRREMARLARETSQARMGRTAETILDVDPTAVDTFMRTEGATWLVHGHTHRPAIHEWMLDGARRTRIVLGDWHDEGRILRWDAQGPRLISTAGTST